MRPAAATVVVVALATWVAPSCGPSADEGRRAEVAAAAGPALHSFESDLDAGRAEDALRRTTVAFQGAATAEAVRSVQGQLRKALGATKSKGPLAVDDVVTAGDPPQVRSAVLSYEAACERGPASVRARVERDASRGGWLVDAYEVRNTLFTWTFRR
jgi:hypothetical protein